jgi:bcepNY3gp66
MNIDEILAERGKTHGKFWEHAKVSQELKEAISCHFDTHANSLSPQQQEALEMICHKIARIVAGNPNFVDHWRDIAGYATLVADELEEQDEKD